MLIHLKDENLEELLKDGKVLLDFYATWCGPCKMLAPILETFSKNSNNIKVIKIDVDEHEEIAKKFSIMSVPTLIYYANGNIIKKDIGYVSLETIEEVFNN